MVVVEVDDGVVLRLLREKAVYLWFFIARLLWRCSASFHSYLGCCACQACVVSWPSNRQSSRPTTTSHSFSTRRIVVQQPTTRCDGAGEASSSLVWELHIFSFLCPEVSKERTCECVNPFSFLPPHLEITASHFPHRPWIDRDHSNWEGKVIDSSPLDAVVLP